MPGVRSQKAFPREVCSRATTSAVGNSTPIITMGNGVKRKRSYLRSSFWRTDMLGKRSPLLSIASLSAMISSTSSAAHPKMSRTSGSKLAVNMAVPEIRALGAFKKLYNY